MELCLSICRSLLGLIQTDLELVVTQALPRATLLIMPVALCREEMLEYRRILLANFTANTGLEELLEAILATLVLLARRKNDGRHLLNAVGALLRLVVVNQE